MLEGALACYQRDVVAMDRNELVTRLVVGTLSRSERRLLGGFVTRAEVGAVIALLLHRHGRFPLDDDRKSGLQLVVAQAGVRIISRRTRWTEASKAGSVTTMEAALDRYIDEELGPSCNGVPIRSEAAPSSRGREPRRS